MEFTKENLQDLLDDPRLDAELANIGSRLRMQISDLNDLELRHDSVHQDIEEARSDEVSIAILNRFIDLRKHLASLCDRQVESILDTLRKRLQTNPAVLNTRQPA